MLSDSIYMSKERQIGIDYEWSPYKLTGVIEKVSILIQVVVTQAYTYIAIPQA